MPLLVHLGYFVQNLRTCNFPAPIHDQLGTTWALLEQYLDNTWALLENIFGTNWKLLWIILGSLDDGLVTTGGTHLCLVGSICNFCIRTSQNKICKKKPFYKTREETIIGFEPSLVMASQKLVCNRKPSFAMSNILTNSGSKI